MNSSVLRYTQPTSLTPTKYTDDLYAKSRKAAEVYDEHTPNDIFIASVAPPFATASERIGP